MRSVATIVELCRKRNTLLYGRNAVSWLHTKYVKEDLHYCDPTYELQKYLTVPLFGENEKIFEPTTESMKEARKLFVPKRNHEICFLKSAVELNSCPQDGVPEVVFMGQSNVGKSSLIRSIFRDVKGLLVKVSKKPGHTRTLNFYNVGKALRIVDVPGYGANQPQHFVESVEEYLKIRKNLRRIFFVCDGSLGLNDWDMVAINMLEEFGTPYALVMTKIDLAKQSRRLNNLTQLQNIRDKCMSTCCFPQPFLVSAVTFEGIGLVQTFVAYVTSNITLK